MNALPHKPQSISPDDIKNYYFINFEKLNNEQQIHFSWSLYSWNQDKAAHKKLLLLKPYLAGDGNLESVWRRLEDESGSNAHGKGKMAKIHLEYFSRHPSLLAKTWQLLYLLRLQTIYGIDARSELLQLHSFASFEQTLANLEQDPEAIAMLSAAAINYIYLFHHLFLGDTDVIDPYRLLNICKPYYDTNNGMHLKIQSYLYTHLVIGESLFFNRSIPESNTHKYQMVMMEAEDFLSKYYFEHGLDNKYEFLACSHFVGNTPTIQTVIMSEAVNSFYDSTLYTFDRLNTNPNMHKPTIANMAHSMTFYILSNSKRSPKGSL